MPIQASTFFQDTIKYIRDDLASGLTDPISSSRTGREKYVMTSYPQREVKYPLVTIMGENITTITNLGFTSVSQLIDFPVEIRVWARNQKEKDSITDQVINRIRSQQFLTNGYKEFGLHDFKINSMVNVDENGDAGIKSRIISISFKVIVGDTC